MVNGGRVNNWACINFSRNVQDSAARGFCHELAIMCQISGMVFTSHFSSSSFFRVFFFLLVVSTYAFFFLSIGFCTGTCAAPTYC